MIAAIEITSKCRNKYKVEYFIIADEKYRFHIFIILSCSSLCIVDWMIKLSNIDWGGNSDLFLHMPLRFIFTCRDFINETINYGDSWFFHVCSDNINRIESIEIQIRK